MNEAWIGFQVLSVLSSAYLCSRLSASRSWDSDLHSDLGCLKVETGVYREIGLLAFSRQQCKTAGKSPKSTGP